MGEGTDICGMKIQGQETCEEGLRESLNQHWSPELGLG